VAIGLALALSQDRPQRRFKVRGCAENTDIDGVGSRLTKMSLNAGFQAPVNSVDGLIKTHIAQGRTLTTNETREITEVLKWANNGTKIDLAKRIKPEPEDLPLYEPQSWGFDKILMVDLDPRTLLPKYKMLPNRSPLRIDAVIFDLDGTLLDSEMASNLALNVPLREHFQIKNAVSLKLHEKILRGGFLEGVDMILEANNITEEMMTREEYIREFSTALEEIEDEIDRMPGSLELLQKLKRRNFPIAVCTSSSRKAFEKKMRRHQAMLQCFDVIITGNDKEVRRGKPHPDAFQVAAKRLGFNSTGRCLVIDDSPVGCVAGKRAGMHVCAAFDHRFRSPDGGFHEADILLLSLEDFDTSWIQPTSEPWNPAPQELS